MHPWTKSYTERLQVLTSLVMTTLRGVLGWRALNRAQRDEPSRKNCQRCVTGSIFFPGGITADDVSDKVDAVEMIVWLVRVSAVDDRSVELEGECPLMKELGEVPLG